MYYKDNKKKQLTDEKVTTIIINRLVKSRLKRHCIN